ncbi:MAG: 4-hydroxyphenylpyruvate dioxygenase [Alphaproteobacteria bacterium]|nr:4-hydroxyphenylpyruvate dioxygenase [Alphaproteobacteria bacterium]MDA7983197.1 4-hydroxyphenylpyruvate dioxygenase [Alphaproteobacteria bacterium]MDA7988788.1 4-hydroxyphenylpyruvate dioxygenase [Alphaproteobacteria bacterium]MDA8008721.1 4-hydroxyphenylpyruvate dioxygenase [Alphaproteobacteria bacterium]
MSELPENIAGTDGFEFVEFAHPNPDKLAALFTQMGYAEVARHKHKDISLYRQGDINYILNREPGSHAARFTDKHGPCAPAMAWRVKNAAVALKCATNAGAEEYTGDKTVAAPAVVGIGGSLLYFVETCGDNGSCYQDEFRWLGAPDPRPRGAGFHTLDHLTHNVRRGNMKTWYDFYAGAFNFREIRFFDIKGRQTGLLSRALTSPDGKIRIPLNESADDDSQIEEYLRQYDGEGIQHIAVACDDIYASVDAIAGNGIRFMPPPPATYYDMLDERVRDHGEPVERMKTHGILVDGEGAAAERAPRLLLQIFSKPVIGPIFFEFIQRKGDDGFGEGNFKALFESIEADQIRRGVLRAEEPVEA